MMGWGRLVRSGVMSMPPMRLWMWWWISGLVRALMVRYVVLVCCTWFADQIAQVMAFF